MNSIQTHTVKNRKKRGVVLQAVRIILQIVFFIFLPALYINAFNEIKLIYTSIIGQTFDISVLWPQILELIAIVPVTILFGRFFCGWMCAFGAFGDFIYKLSKKAFHIKYKISEKADHVLKFVKYGILLASILILWNVSLPALSAANPWDVFGMLFTFGSLPDIGYVAANLTLGLIILLLISILSIFIERFFCRYLCPLGAVFAIVSRLRIAKIAKPSQKCGNCRICTNVCAMGIPLYKEEKISSGECIQCMQCVGACPRKNANLSLAGSDVRPLLAGTMAAIAIAGIYQTSSFALAEARVTSSSSVITAAASAQAFASAITSDVSEGSTASTSASASASSSASASASASAAATPSVSSLVYQNGTYTGTGTGFRGAETTLSITIENDAITDITVVSYGDDAPYFERAYDSVVSSILSTQSTDVDAVSGATYSSNGIMSAVADALSQAAI